MRAGRFTHCVICGKEIAPNRQARGAMTCGDEVCRKKRVAEYERYEKPKKGRQSTGRRGSALGEICRAAREAGLTYGQYVAKMGQ